jgi:alkylation response protein AidB-like acyl-CoA dehydrogenase
LRTRRCLGDGQSRRWDTGRGSTLMGDLYHGPGGVREFRTDFAAWLEEHHGLFAKPAAGVSLADEATRTRNNQRHLWEAGWLRHGWPESVGGLGGSALLRAAAAEEAARRELFYNTVFAMVEVLAPTVIALAPALAAEHVTPFLNGTVGWAQGFSEPEAGSDLASLRCRAVDAGDHWVVTGQKVWSSYAQFASKMVLLARTGTPQSRHRGITAMLVDLDAPGLTVRPMDAINGVPEFSETFFDEVRVPKNRLIGEIGGGWRVAMSILRSERGGIFWMLSIWLLNQLHGIGHTADPRVGDQALGSAVASVVALRARSWLTQHRLAAGQMEIPETSIDKRLMACAEQELFELARALSDGALEFGDDTAAVSLRAEFMYSLAASIYGGTAEIQRNIIADQLLGLRGV